MAILRYKEIAKLNQKERNDKLAELKKDLIKIKAQLVTGSQKAGKFRELRKTVARMLTIQNLEGKKVKE